MQRNIVVVPYDSGWAAEFEKIKSELMPALSGSALGIEHVGSTSVPGLCAKPIIDIDIVTESGGFETVKAHLQTLGYQHRGHLGIPGREAFGYDGKAHLMEHHLYVCAKDAAELKRHLALRDYLRAHAAEREQYGRIKQQMAILHPHDIDAYLAGKQPFILAVYRKCGLPLQPHDQ